MTEDQHREWDIIFRFIAGIGIIISFIYGIREFEISSRRDFAKEFYEEEIIFYNNLVQTTSKLASPSINDSIKKQLILSFDNINRGQKDYFVKDSILLDYIRKYNDVVVFIKNGLEEFSETQTTYERANQYAILIGKRSRKNINDIIYQLDNK